MTSDQIRDIRNDILIRIDKDIVDAKIFIDGYVGIEDIYEPHNNDQWPIELDINKWDASYRYRQKVELSYNFSKERLMHILEVVEKLNSQLHDVSSGEQKVEISENTRERNFKKKIIFLLIGILTITVVFIVIMAYKDLIMN